MASIKGNSLNLKKLKSNNSDFSIESNSLSEEKSTKIYSRN
jgi:hypothetical protein